METVGEGEGETNGESSINIHILLGVRGTSGEKPLCSTENPVLLCDDVNV